MRDRYRVKRHFAVRVLLGALLALLLPSGAAVPSEQVPTPDLIDLEPGQDAVLGSLEPLYLRLRDRSATPIHILLSGHYRGDVVHGYRQDSEELFPAGNREATVWLAYPFGARIDQIRVRVWNANKAQVAAADFPINAAWRGAKGTSEAARRMTKSWVAGLTPAQRERRTATLSGASEPGGFDPFDLIFLCVPGYFLLQAALTFRTSGGWRKATLVPAVIMAPVVAFTVLAFAAQSNLWPILLILSAPLPLSRRPERHPPAAPACQGRVIGDAPLAIVSYGRALSFLTSSEPIGRDLVQARGAAQCANTRSVSRRMNAAAAGPVAGPS
jgi:hypothetical protein